MICFVKDDLENRVKELIAERKKLHSETMVKIGEIELMNMRQKLMGIEVDLLIAKLKNAI